MNTERAENAGTDYECTFPDCSCVGEGLRECYGKAERRVLIKSLADAAHKREPTQDEIDRTAIFLCEADGAEPNVMIHWWNGDIQEPWGEQWRKYVGMAKAVLQLFAAARDDGVGTVPPAQDEFDHPFRNAWQEIADAMGIPAMVISPKQVHESVLMPKLRELLNARP